MASMSAIAVLALGACAGSDVKLETPSPAMTQAFTSAGGDRCVETVTSALQGLGVMPSDIDYVESDQRIDGPANDQRLEGYTIWTGLKDKTGYVVVYTLPDCHFLSVFTRGEVKIKDGKIVT